MKKYLFFALILGLGMGVSSCGGGGDNAAKPRYDYERADSLPEEYLQELANVRTSIEISSQLYDQMQSNGIAFDQGKLISAGKSFSGSSKQAAGLGAYIHSVVCAVSFGQNQAGTDYLKGINDIAGQLGVASAFDAELMEKMTSGADSTTNRSVLLTKAYLKAKDQMFSEDRAQLATEMTVGGWIEGVNVASELMQGQAKNNSLKLTYWELVTSYKSVIHILDVFKSNSEIATLLKDLEAIKPQVEAITENARGFSDSDLTALRDAVKSLKSKHIG